MIKNEGKNITKEKENYKKIKKKKTTNGKLIDFDKIIKTKGNFT